MPSEPSSEGVHLQVASLDISVTQHTIRVGYGVKLTTAAFEGVVGAGETVFSDPSGEIHEEMFQLVQRIQEAINKDLGLQEAGTDGAPANDEDEL